jgi:hypothetical protein
MLSFAQIDGSQVVTNKKPTRILKSQNGIKTLLQAHILVILPSYLNFLYSFPKDLAQFLPIHNCQYISLSAFFITQENKVTSHYAIKEKVRKRTIPTEQPPLVGEVSANFCG